MDEQPAMFPSVDLATSKIEEFLAPLLDSQRTRNPHQTLADILLEVTPNPTAASRKAAKQDVVLRGGYLLRDLHKAVNEDALPKGNLRALFKPAMIQLFDALMDYLMLEGVYPGMSHGICDRKARVTKSALFHDGAPDCEEQENLELLEKIIYVIIVEIMVDKNPGIKGLIREQTLQDVIAAMADSAFTQSRMELGRQASGPVFAGVIDILPLATLYKIFSQLTRSRTAPGCFQEGIAAELAILPARPNGVRGAIEFIASQYPAPTSNSKSSENQPGSAGRPEVSMEALRHMARVLPATPRWRTTDDWYKVIGPQLKSLLDDQRDPDNRRVAAFIISHGILGKRSLGGPESVGWKTFVGPIFDRLNPPSQSEATIPEFDIKCQLTRLSALLSANPSPSLTGRLLRPLLLPLWALCNCQKKGVQKFETAKIAYDLLLVFQTLSGNLQSLQFLASKLLWDGGKRWTFGPGNNKGICILSVSRCPRSQNPVQLISTISSRAEKYCQLLSALYALDAKDDTIGALIVDLTRKWLLSPETTLEGLIGGDSESEATDKLVVIKLVQTLLERFKDALASSPLHILDLIGQLLKQQVQLRNEATRKVVDLRNAKITSLSDIVKSGKAGEASRSDNENATDVIMIALSLLSNILESPLFKRSEHTNLILADTLESIRRLMSASRGNISLFESLQVVSDRVEAITGAPAVFKAKTAAQTRRSAAMFQGDFGQIQMDIASDLPPVRTSAIHWLEILIQDVDVIIDVPAVTLLLLHTVRTDPEDYVNLAAIRVLVVLAMTRNPPLVVKLTTDAFRDIEEAADVDGRLRIGEALSKMATEIGDYNKRTTVRAFRKPVINTIAATMIVVAGRRGNREKELEERQKTDRLKKMSERDPDKAHDADADELESEGGSVQLPTEERSSSDGDYEEVVSMIAQWRDTDVEEDIRIRTSALSILGRTIEFGIEDLNPKTIEISIEIAVSILAVETQESRSILRRAAALLIMSLLRAANSASESNTLMFHGFSDMTQEKWTEVEKILQYIKNSDEDELTREYTATVLEGLESWRMNVVLGLGEINIKDKLGPNLELKGKLRGLSVDPEASLEGTDSLYAKIEEVD